MAEDLLQAFTFSNKKWRLKNKVGEYRATKTWCENNLERVRELHRNFRLRHIDKIRKEKRQWYVRHWQEEHDRCAKRYAKRVGMTRSEIMKRIKCVSMMEKSARSFVTMLAGCRLVHQPKLIYGRPDYANKQKQIAVFCDGCLWHGCPKHFKLPKTKVSFWANKIINNQLRDIEVTHRLRKDGWKVIRMWEHEL